MAHKRIDAENYTVTMGDRGRLVLPASVRSRLGLSEGDRLVLTLEQDGSLKLVALRDAVRKLRGSYAHLAPDRSLADELIAERREEVRREEAD
ncbi:MAG: AbrB/MazE/SpoVT family DNA-binding domain-containing protein [Rubrobacter sp.]|nr:AbrB/MazE/SpoVT family DNA-binding domain-containing protein [Rubrobacter sp.]